MFLPRRGEKRLCSSPFKGEVRRGMGLQAHWKPVDSLTDYTLLGLRFSLATRPSILSTHPNSLFTKNRLLVTHHYSPMTDH